MDPARPNGPRFDGEPSEQRERPERSKGRRVRWTRMLGALNCNPHPQHSKIRQECEQKQRIPVLGGVPA